MAKRASRPALALTVLTAINLCNYADRYISSALKESIRNDLHLSNVQTSLPLSAFVVVYMMASPFVAAAGDRFPRRGVLAAAVVIWSLATISAGLTSSFWGLLCCRALVGVGEAAYVSIGPSFISDLFRPGRRSAALAVFYAAVPLGIAAGFSVAAFAARTYGWRATFGIFGAPGLALAALLFTIPEPERGALDASAPSDQHPRWRIVAETLLANREYLLLVAGYTCVTFATGIIGDWLIVYLTRSCAMSGTAASSLVGASILIGGTVGTLFGGFATTRLGAKSRKTPLALSAASTAAAALAAACLFGGQRRSIVVASTVIAQAFVWVHNGPVNASIASAVPSRMRARAFSVAVLSTHLLGDAIGPPIVGALADRGAFGAGLFLAPSMLLVAAAIWGVAWYLSVEPTAGISIAARAVGTGET